MYFVSFGAVRRRAGQSVMVLVLAALVAAVAAAAPWYGLAVATRAGQTHVTLAPIAQRVLSAQRQGDTAGDPRAALDNFSATVRGLLPLPGATPLAGLTVDMTYTDARRANAPIGLPVAYRDGFCAHVRLTGACPATSGEAALSVGAAQRLGLAAGDAFTVRPKDATTPLRLRVTGTYERTDPAYWTDKLFLARGDLEPAFTTLDTFRQPALARPVLSVDTEVPAALLRGDNRFDLATRLDAAKPSLAAGQIDFGDSTGPLLTAISDGRYKVWVGVLVPLGLVVLLGWFALGLAGRFTGRDRRADAALLKLRGSTRGGILRLAMGQHLVPLLGGALAGLPIGLLAAWLLAGRLPVRAEWWPALLLAVAAVAVVLAGGLVALTAVDWIAQRAPVAALLRRIPSGRRDWRSAVIDAALIALAAGAVYQARSTGPDYGLGVAAAPLAALAVALLLARLLRSVADRAGGAAVRAGRLRAGLTAVQFSRQPGTDRVFALVVVSVAVFVLTAGGLAAGREGRHARAEQELGADRVLTVAAQTRTQLLDAVRRADPAGRYAMAAVVDTASNPPTLAVDSVRLAAVSGLRLPPFPAPDPLPLITGGRFDLTVTGTGSRPPGLGVTLQHERTGAVVHAEFGAIRPGTSTVSTAVPGCAAPPGCRLVAVQLLSTPGANGSVIVHGGTVLDAAALADVTRWRTDYGGPGVQLTAGPDGLTLTSGDTPDQAAGTGVYPVESAVPLPVVLAGPAPTPWRFDDAALPGAALPVTVAATARVLPALGVSGVLMDLDETRRLGGEGGTFQVWLAPDTPAPVVQAIGLPVVTDRTVAGRTAELAGEESVVAAPFALFTVGIAVLLAAAMVAVGAAVDRGPQEEQLRALRVQGLPRRAALSSAYAGGSALVLTGIVGGVLAALVAGPGAAVTAPPFADGWDVLPPPGALGIVPLLLAVLFALVVLGVTAWLSALPLVRRLR
jgi:putative ABC transport system permease protein